MNFMQAIEQVKAGKVVVSPSVLPLGMKFEEGVLIDVAANDALTLDNALLNATDFAHKAVSTVALNDDEAYLFFDDEKARWISTVNPQKHLDAGRRVAVFSLQESI